MTFGLSGAAIGGIIAAAGTVGGAMISANGAQDAASIQAGAAGAGVAENSRQFNTVRDLLSPFVNAATGTPATPGGQFDAKAYLAQNPDVAQDPYYGQHPLEHYTAVGKSEGRVAPLTQASAGSPGALDSYMGLIGLKGAPAQQAGIDSIKSGAEFGSLTKQGEDAILQNASATGGLRGGNTQNSLATFRSNLLSSLIDKQLSQYSGLAQMGQNSAARVGSSALTTGQANANLMQQAGSAQAGGIMAGSNALTGALGGVSGLLAGRAASTPATVIPAPTAMSEIGGGGGFGSGIVYGNQDMGQNF